MRTSRILPMLAIGIAVSAHARADEISNLFAVTPAPQAQAAPANIVQQTAATTAQPAPPSAQAAPAPQAAPKAVPPDFAVWPDLPTPQEAAAFKAAGQAALPLSPAEVAKFKAANIAIEKAMVKQKLTPINISIPVSLEPGGQSPEIFVAANKGTTLILLDSTGNPWPVNKGFAPGSNEMIDVTDTKSPTNNTFIVVPKSAMSYVDTNLTLPLKDTSVPIIVRLSSTDDGKYHERVELRVQRAGPNAPAAIVAEDMPNLVDPVYQSVLDGAPIGLTQRKTDAAGVAVWEDRKQQALYLRTAYRLLSPAHTKEGQGADGTWAYRLPLTPRLLLANNAGERVHVKIQGVGDE